MVFLQEVGKVRFRTKQPIINHSTFFVICQYIVMVQCLCITPASMGDMPYTTNPHLPRLRMEAAQLVLRQGWSTRQVARYTGFDQSTVVRWVAKARRTTRRG